MYITNVRQRPANVEIAVEADGAEVEYRRRGAHDISRQPDITENSAERPASHHVIGDGERHDNAGDEHVSQSQWHEEVVASLTQRSVRQDGRYHQQVAGHREDDDERQKDGQGDVCCQSAATTTAFVVVVVVVARRRVPDWTEDGRQRGRMVLGDGGGRVQTQH